MKVSLRNLTVVLAMLMILTLIRCGQVNAAHNPSAERVFTTEAGYICFLIRDDEGKGVGGNCIKEN